ncbi:UNVERIFIED_CONTAM: hypothetical protein FKN15_042911 [Acipenser sinensis]
MVKDSLAAVPDLDEIREKVRKTVGYFKSSTVAKEELAALQRDLKQNDLKLIQEVDTRSAAGGPCKKREDYLEWPEYFMAVAFLSAQRSKDPSSQGIPQFF